MATTDDRIRAWCASAPALVLPTMYADFIAYTAAKSVVWGGHSRNLARFEEFSPVLRKPLDYFVERYAVDYVVLDDAYAPAERLGVATSLSTLERFGSIGVHEFVRPAAALQPDWPSASALNAATVRDPLRCASAVGLARGRLRRPEYRRSGSRKLLSFLEPEKDGYGSTEGGFDCVARVNEGALRRGD